VLLDIPQTVSLCTCNLVDALRVSARFIRHSIYTSLYQLYRHSEFWSSDGLFELHMAPLFFEMD
jgi:hypothetical protein